MSKKRRFILVALCYLITTSLCFSKSYSIDNKICETLVGKKNTIYANSDFFAKETKHINNQLKKCETIKSSAIYYQKLGSEHDFITTLSIKKMIKNHPQKVIGMMGRGSIKRHSKQYKDAAFIAKSLAEKNYMIITGGGPGAMEAAHLGVWFAGRKKQALIEAIDLLSKHWDTNSPSYFQIVNEIKHKYPRVKKTSDLAILTYVYGTKLANGFANKYTVYFNNAVREETITIVSRDGIIFLPGGYGTQIELFISLEYNSDGIETNPSRPIILFNAPFWKTIFSNRFLQKMKMTDDISAIPDLIESKGQ